MAENFSTSTFGEALFGDLLPLNVLSVTEDRYLLAIQQFVERENEFMSRIMSILADRGTQPQTGFLNGVGGRMQKMSQGGGVEATRGGQRWFTGYPIYAWGNKQTYEIPWLKRATFVELGASIATAVMQDIETVITELLRAILRNDTYTFDDSQWPGMKAEWMPNVANGGSGALLSCAPMANADGSPGSVYAWGQEVALSNLNFYLTSGASEPTISTFRTMLSNLRMVGNDADPVCIVNRTDADYIQQNFGSDFILPVERLEMNWEQDLFGKYAIRSQEGILGPVVRSRGRLSNFVELVEWPHWPQGYAFMYDRSKEPPLRVRESDLADERGFGMAPADPGIPDVQGNPLLRKQWRRIFGVAGRNRCNGVVMQYTASDDYTTPTL